MIILVIWAVITTFSLLWVVLASIRRQTVFGHIIVIKTEEGTTYLLELNDHPEEIENSDYVLFKVVTKDRTE